MGLLTALRCFKWVTQREECTNRILLLDRGHAEKILHDYTHHVTNHRPHQGRDQLAPNDNPTVIPLAPPRIERHRAVTVWGSNIGFRSWPADLWAPVLVMS
jgi:hypothetical protein